MTIRPVLALIAALGLSACGNNMAGYDPHQRYQVQVDQRTATATIGETMGATDRQVLRDLAAEFVRRSAGPAMVEGKTAEEVAGALAEAGIPRDRIEVKVTEAGGAIVRVPVWVANVPECGHFSKRINTDFGNQNSLNFGCSVTRNIGLMVSDPADLVRARETDGRDANRAVDVLGKYQQGKTTASAVEEAKPTATISVVGK